METASTSPVPLTPGADTSSSASQAEWEKVFSEASLNLVAVRKSFYGSALFLCRRRQSPSKRPAFLPVDGADYQWVETLKVGSNLVLSSRTLSHRS